MIRMNLVYEMHSLLISKYSFSMGKCLQDKILAFCYHEHSINVWSFSQVN